MLSYLPSPLRSGDSQGGPLFSGHFRGITVLSLGHYIRNSTVIASKRIRSSKIDYLTRGSFYVEIEFGVNNPADAFFKFL